MSNPINQSMPLFALVAASASPAATATIKNRFWRGLKLIINITAITGTTPTLTVTIKGVDPVSGATWTVLVSAALNATGTTVLTVYPGLTASANVTANDVLPESWQVSAAIAGTTPAVTATIAAQGLV